MASVRRATAILIVALSASSLYAQNREVNANLQVNGQAVAVGNRVPVTCDNCSGGGGVGTDVNVTDRAARLLGIIYGNLGQVQQRASTLELLVQLRSGGSEIDPRQVTIQNASIAVTGPLTDTQLRASAVPVSGTFWQATQPVSASSLPLPTGAATDRATAAAPFSMRLTDGSAFYDGTKTGQLPAALDGSGFLKVHEQGTATVSGTVTANAGTNLNTSALALDATLTGGTQKAIARGGAKGATAAADVTSTANGADHQGLDVQVQNASIAVTGTFWQTTQPVSGTVTTSPPSNATTNVTQLNGTTVDTNSGSKTAGTLRVVLATDQPQLTNKLLVTPDSVALPANQSVNISQINGVTPLMGNGATGTGSPRITISSDNSAVSGLGAGATGSSPPANAVYQGARESTNLVGLVQCDKSAQAAISTAANTQLVALSGSTVIYVCSYVIEIQGVATTAGTNKLNYGTGTACATGTVQITPDYIGSLTAGNPTVVAQTAGNGYLFKTTAGQALCSTTTTTTVQKVFVTYAQF
jgi:hypothetical protein